MADHGTTRLGALALVGLLAFGSAAFGKETYSRRLSGCESLEGWGENAELVSGAVEGKFAVAARLKGGRRSRGLQFDFAHTGVDLSQVYAVSFRWRVEGEGLRGMMVRVRNYPISDGKEAIYRVWDPESGSDPAEWQRATAVISRPDYDGRGEPDHEARYLAFSAWMSRGAEVRIFVDDIQVLEPTFEWEVGRPVEQGGGWYAPVKLRNLTEKALSLSLGRDAKPIQRKSVASQGQADVRLPLGDALVDDLKPLEFKTVSLWALVADAPETRQDAAVKVVKPIALPPHPRLLFNREGIEALKQRVAQHDWARSRWERVVSGADRLLTETVELPPRGGNWYHWYACPTHGASFKRGKPISKWQWEHICPVDDEVFLGDASDPSHDYDGCVLNSIHSRWARAIRDLGLVYQVTGEMRYAQKAREILLTYADRYLQYPLHTTRGQARIGGGRVGCQTLNEAGWTITMCQGADLVWDALSQDDRKAVSEKLFQPAAREVILPHRMGVHNIQCWKNSGVGLVGFLLGDMELIWEAVENPDRGYRRQMQEGVPPDGMWWEGAWGYHFYTMSALWGLTEAARNCGMDLYGDAYKRMFDAPLKFAMPSLRLPAFNDGGETGLKGRSSLYELAYARYRDPSYLALLKTSDRQDDMALWFGAEAGMDAPSLAWESANHPASGYAILASGEGEAATWFCLDYGPHGGGHGHPDKLGFVLAARGETGGIDPGTAKYGLPIQGGWYKTTLAHNTLVVDEDSQKRAEGRCIAFGQTAGADYVVAEAGDIYDGLHFVRSATLLGEDLVVFIDQVKANETHMLDLVYHMRGAWADLPEGDAWTTPDKNGYRYLRDATHRKDTDGLSLGVQVNAGWQASVVLAGGEETEVITATGIGRHVEDRAPTVVFRRNTAETAFGWCVALNGEAVAMQWLGVTDASGKAVASSVAAALAVTPPGGKTRFLLANPDGRSVQVGLPDGTVWQVEAIFAVR